MYAGRPAGKIAYGGWRWAGVNIPENATILSAYVEFRQKDWGNVFPTNLAFENSPTPAAFSSGSTPADRWNNKTAFAVEWTWPKSSPDTWLQTPDLTAGIQELVDTYGGITDLVLIEDGSPATGDAWHAWYSYDGGSGAKLHIEYESGVDETPPERSNGAPTGDLESGTTETTLSLDANENATCGYDTVTGTEYSSMPNTFATTGGTSHSTTVMGLEDGNTYSYYVRCEDEAGNANADDFEISFAVLEPDIEAPTVPQNLQAEALSSTSIALVWDPSTDNVGVAGYRVFRDAVEIATTTDTSYSDTGLSASATHVYTVSAFDEAENESAQSVEAQATTLEEGEGTWPTNGWETATPGDVGMDEAKLIEARDYAVEKGGGSGMITRYGKAVMTWGDTSATYDLKSTTKSIGVTALGLALQDGLVNLSDLAQEHHPTIGIPPDSNADTGWLELITLLHLATHTAGFDKAGGYEEILFEPGTAWFYTDGGANWLAEALTLVYGQDMRDLLFERAFTHMGITSSDLTWRDNVYRDPFIDTFNGPEKRREFGSGISADVDSMARIGYLYLRNGQWENNQLIPISFVEAARQPVPSVESLPLFDSNRWPGAPQHYGLLWWNNADGRLPNVPTDTYTSWGLHESFIIVIPSLDIVVSRAGSDWRTDLTEDFYDVMEPFLDAIVCSVTCEPDTIPPTVSVTDPLDGTTVSGTITVSAEASDDVGVAGVQFLLDGAELGDEITAEPYEISWDAGTAANGDYILAARARDASGNETTSDPVSVTVDNPVDTEAPSVPADLSATAVSSSQIDLSWTASTDNVEVAGYRVFRDAVEIATTPDTSFADTGLSASTTHVYTVSAFDEAGNESEQSQSAPATTLEQGSDADLLGYWAFDEGAGTTANDSSGNGNHGTLVNDPTWTGAGKVNGALVFDGTNDYVSIPKFTIAGPHTISVWVHPDTLASGTAYDMVLGQIDSDNYLSFKNGNILQLQDHGSVSKDWSVVVSPGHWTHIAITTDGSIWEAFVNGTSLGTNTLSSTNGHLLINAIGQGYTDNNHAFHGLVDEVRLYDRVLTAAEVADLASL